MLSLAIILLVKNVAGDYNWLQWGWRIPFLLSIVLVGVSIYIRLRLDESPMFAELAKENRLAKNPFVETFGAAENLKYMALALFGATMGQGMLKV